MYSNACPSILLTRTIATCLPLAQAPGLASTVDFVWVSSHAAVAQLLHAQHPRDARGMPHAAAPSDHLMLGATFVLLAAAPRADGGAVEVAPAEQFHCGWGSGYSDY